MNKKDRDVLAAVAAGTASAQGYALITDGQAKSLVAGGFVETNAEIRDGNKIAARITDKGTAEMADTNTAADTPADDAGASSFEIEDGIAMPSKKTRRNATVYPFDRLAVGQSFHVPATAERSDPTKSMASTVSSANRRYANETGETRTFTRKGKEYTTPVLSYTRRFEVAEAGEDDPKGKGARIFRTA